MASFETFVHSCNTLHPTIKFTSECSTTEINFLDMTIYKGTNFQNKQILNIKTYTKPTNKQTYVHGSSFHPPGVGKSIALGEAYRYLRTNSDETNVLYQIHKLKNTLLSRGYEDRVIKPLIRRVRYKDRHKVIHKTKQETGQQGHAYTGPYLQHTHTASPRSIKPDLERLQTRPATKRTLSRAPTHCSIKEPVIK